MGAPDVPASAWSPSKIDLGGVFYDHLLDADKTVVGVRYYGMGEHLMTHPVLSRFLNDERFRFEEKGGHADIFFGSKNAARLAHLEVNGAQEFGGDSALQLGEWLALSFTLCSE
jgi:hypothetical protein